jgi:hypothetical protein
MSGSGSAPDRLTENDPARIASATFDFSHPSNRSVNRPVSSGDRGLQPIGRVAPSAG